MTTPDLIVVSEGILTMDPAEERPPGAVAIAGDRIAGLLARDEVDDARGPGTAVLDVGERTVLPGFVDPHAHVEVACRATDATVDVRTPECGSIDDVLAVLAEGLRTTETGWVIGQGNLFFDRKLAERRLPTREELDRVSRDVPIAIRAGGHVTVLSSKALELAGIGRGYTPPGHSVTGKPGVELRDGEPTGVVKEMDALLPFPPLDEGDIRRALRTGVRRLFTAHGVTTIGEISESVAGIRQMDDLARDGELGARIRVYLWAPGTVSLDEAVRHRELLPLSADPGDVRVQGLKLFSDGGFSAASAAVKQPYVHVDCAHHGDIALSPREVREALERTRDAGLQLAIHANGDRAQDWLCGVIADAGGTPAGALPTRIEHAGNFLPTHESTALWRAAGIIPVPQPVFLYTFGDYFEDYLGPYGTRGRFPFRRLLDDGWGISGSSDVWVGSEREATNPLFSVWCCLARRSYAGRTIDADQAVTLEEALRMHTLAGAQVLGEDGDKGSLEVGKLADLVVLDRDITRAAVDDVRDAGVEHVLLGGTSVLARQER